MPLLIKKDSIEEDLAGEVDYPSFRYDIATLAMCLQGISVESQLIFLGLFSCYTISCRTFKI